MLDFGIVLVFSILAAAKLTVLAGLITVALLAARDDLDARR